MSDNSQDLLLDVHLEFLFYESLSNHTQLLSIYKEKKNVLSEENKLIRKVEIRVCIEFSMIENKTKKYHTCNSGAR